MVSPQAELGPTNSLGKWVAFVALHTTAKPAATTAVVKEGGDEATGSAGAALEDLGADADDDPITVVEVVG